MKSIYTVISALLLLVLVSCKDDGVTNKSSDSIIGEWRWVKSCGGIYPGTISTPESVGYNYFYTFRVDNKIVYKRNSDVLSTYDYTYKKGMSNILNDSVNILTVSHIISINNKDSISYDLRSIVNFHKDSLILSDDFVDGQDHYYVKP